MSEPAEDGTVLVRRELVTAEPALALAGLLGVDAPLESEGLPLLWHWLHTLERPAQSDLGADGHPVRGVVPAPPAPGRRRMWAGGSVRTLAPVRVGRELTRRSRVRSATDKQGRSGAMTLVEVEHVLLQDDTVVVQERQDIVYRMPPPSGGPDRPAADGGTAAPPAPPVDAVDGWQIPVTPTLLFRFSALTYNAHRIHYDREYATRVEGYPGLVTHGPLQAIAMVEAARRRGVATAAGAQVDYRLVSPLFDEQGLVAATTETAPGTYDLAVHDLAGRRTATARLTVDT